MYIEERTEVADVTFPTQPMVLSLRDYDRAEDASPNPVQGYPLVCVTVRQHGLLCPLSCPHCVMFPWSASRYGNIAFIALWHVLIVSCVRHGTAT